MKRPLKFRVATLVIAISCIGYACSENSTESINVEAPGNSAGVLALPDYSSIHNPLNPCNDFGVLHNAGLDYILDYYSVSSFEELTYEQVRYATARFTVENAELLEISDLSVLEDLVDDVVENVTIEDAFQSLPLSSEQIEFCNQIRDGVLTAEFSSLDQFIQMLESIEQDILNSSIPEHQKEFPLMVMAIAKHSAVYHAESIGIPESSAKHGGDTILEMDEKKKEKRFAQVVEADLVGAITGASLGFIGGLVSGFIGGALLGGGIGGIPGAAATAITGSAVGAVTGAVGGSGAYILKPS